MATVMELSGSRDNASRKAASMTSLPPGPRTKKAAPLLSKSATDRSWSTLSLKRSNSTSFSLTRTAAETARPDLLLQLEEILARAVETLAPDLTVAGPVDQAEGEAEAAGAPSNGAFQSELSPALRGRRLADHVDRRVSTEAVIQIDAQPVRQEIRLLVAVHRELPNRERMVRRASWFGGTGQGRTGSAQLGPLRSPHRRDLSRGSSRRPTRQRSDSRAWRSCG